MHIGISDCLTNVAYDEASPTGLVWTQTIGTRAKAGAVVRAGAYWLEGKQHWEASVTLNGMRKYKRNKDKTVVDAWLEATKKEVHGEYKAASQ